jgi:hypothetical protein
LEDRKLDQDTGDPLALITIAEVIIFLSLLNFKRFISK